VTLRRVLALAVIVAAATSAAIPAGAQRPLNLGFEMPSVSYADRPWGWTLGWSAFASGPAATFVLDSAQRTEGARSLRITAADTDTAAPPRALMLQLPAAFVRGRDVRLAGRVRALDLRGRALVLLEAWRDQAMGAADTFALPRHGGDWQSFELSIRVPADEAIHSLVVSAAVQGAGSAWFDGLEFRLDGVPIRALPTDPPPPTPRELAWLAGRSTPLTAVTTTTAPAADADLGAFDRIVGQARVVGLGESTHGTREFFQVKDRLLDHLVRRHGFDLFAIEANQLAVERLNRYVLGDTGTTRDAMRVMFRVWNTEEMAALVERVRAHNLATPARPVRFVGYDMQDNRTPFDSLVAFVAMAEPAFESRVRALSDEYRAERSFATPHLPEERRRAWHVRAESLWVEVAGRRPAWLGMARIGADSIRAEWAVHAADLFRQAARLNATLNSPDRDSLMAANLDWAMRTLYPRSRVVVWAHDVHVAKGGDAKLSFNAGAELGAHLRRTYGHDYRAFSLLTRTGAYSATRGFTDHTMISAEAFAAPEGSVEAALANVARPAQSIGLIVDLRGPHDEPGAQWLWRSRPVRHIGYAAYDYGFELLAVMPLEFDGIIYVERTTASRLLP
jgi:erythromycin esterase